MSTSASLNSLLSSGTSTSTGVDLSSLLTAATGASSVGIDVTSAVDAAIYAVRAPERQWQAQQTTAQSQITALQAIQSALSAVTSDLTTLNSPTGSLAAKTSTSNNPSVITATVSANAAAGTHTVTVSSLAASASWYSAPVSGPSATLGSSTLQISQPSGTTTSFALGTNGLTSLQAVANAVNAASIGINASVITDTSGSRLALVSQNSGASQNFSAVDTQSTAAAAWTSASLASSSTPLQASSFSIGDGASTQSITVHSGDTLASIANQINQSGLNLTAQVVSDGSGSHLSLAAGSGAMLTVSTDPTLALTQATVGADAHLAVDGVPVQSASNSVSGVIAGVTLNLQNTSGSAPVRIAVAADANSISSAVSQFVTDYNSALSLVNAQFTYSASSNSQGVLGSDAAVRSLQSALLGLTAFTPSGASASTPGVVTNLAALGISVQDDGSLSLNTDTLAQVVSSDSDAVQNFFQGAALNGFAQSATKQLSTYSSVATGIIAADISQLTQQSSTLGSEVSDYESGYVASQQTLLTAMYSKAEIALQQLPTTLKQIQAQFGNNSGS